MSFSILGDELINVRMSEGEKESDGKDSNNNGWVS